MKFKAYWYDQHKIVYTDPTPIEANSKADATAQAYVRFNGKPPAPILYLEEMVK